MLIEAFDVYRSFIRKWLIPGISVVVIAALVSYFVSLTIPKTYESTAQLLVKPAAAPATGFIEDVSLGTIQARNYSPLVKSVGVLQDARDLLDGIVSVGTISDAIRVAQIRDTSIITVTAAAGDPALAAQIANAVADAFIGRTKGLGERIFTTTSTEVEKQISGISSEIDDLNGQLADLQSQINAGTSLRSPAPSSRPATTADPTTITALRAEVQRLENSRALRQQTLATLVRTRDDLRLAQTSSTTSVLIWQTASPGGPVSPRPLVNAALAAFIALVLFLGFMLVVSYVDDTLRDPDQALKRLNVPVIGVITAMENPRSLRNKVIVRDQPSAPQAEAFRAVRTNLLFAELDTPIRILLVTSTMPNEGKSVTAANLAVSFALGGTQTVLVDADLRRPSQHRLFGVPATFGLTGHLADSSRSPLIQTTVPNLSVVPCGPLPANPAEVVGSARMKQFLASLTRVPGQLVIVDSPPINAVADPTILAAGADGVMLVVEAGRIRIAAIKGALERLKVVQAKVLGIVLNKGGADQLGYWYYYYRTYEYKADQKRAALPTS